MKKFVFLLIILFQTISFSQSGIVNVIVSPVNETTINVKSMVRFLTVASYVDHDIDIENNSITLNLCYHVTILTDIVVVTHDNLIDISGLTGPYTLNINIFEDSNGCFTNPIESKSMELILPLEEEVSLSNPTYQENNISLYPNPTTDVLHLTNPQSITSVKVYDALGKLVLEQYNSFSLIDISKLSKGLLFIKIETDNGVFTKKVIKQ